MPIPSNHPCPTGLPDKIILCAWDRTLAIVSILTNLKCNPLNVDQGNFESSPGLKLNQAVINYFRILPMAVREPGADRILE